MERNIFGPYWNGKSNVYGDPLRIHRLLVRELNGEHRQIHQQARDTDDAIAAAAQERLLAAIRVSFEMELWDKTTGTGADEAACFDVYDAFCVWEVKKKQKDASSLILQAVSAGMPPTNASPLNPTTTPSASSG